MSEIDIYRDALFGNPPSPTWEPSREGSLAAFTALYQRVLAIVSGVRSYATVASLPASVDDAPVGTQARVFADPTDANNTYWIRTASSGPNNGWVIDQDYIDSVASVVEPIRDEAVEARDEAVDAAESATASALDLTTDQSGRITQSFTRTGYINVTTGALVSDSAWRTTPLYEIAYLDIARLKLYGQTNVASISFFDTNQVYISGVAAASTGAYVNSYPAPPSNAVYVAFTMQVADLANQRFTPVLKYGNMLPSNLDDQSVKIGKLFTVTGYIRSGTNGTAGALAVDVNWRTTPRIEIAYLDVFRIKLSGNPAACNVAFYDASDTFISGAIAATDGAFITSYPTPPANTTYVRFTMRVSALAQQKFDFFIRAAALPPTNGTVPIDLAPNATINGFITNAGTLTTDANWLSTDFLTFPAGGVITVNLWGHSAISSVTFYDSNKNMIGTRNGSATANSAYVATVTSPAGTAFTRLSMGNPASSTIGYPIGFVNSALYQFPLKSYLAGQLNPPAAAAFSIQPFKRRRAIKMGAGKVLRTYGDSRSSTDYAFVLSNWQALFPNATINVGGFSGTTVAQQADDSRLNTIFADNPDVIVFLPGGNDAGAAGTVGTFSGVIAGESTVTPTDITANYAGTRFIQAVDHIVRKIQANYYNIRARANLTGSETEAEKNAKIRAVKKPMLIVCTDLPQQRINSANAFSLAANWERKRQAIIEVCARNKVHCVDTMAQIGWDMSLEPFYPGTTDKNTNYGINTMDGLHQNEFGDEAKNELIAADAGLIPA